MQQIVNELLSTAALCDARFFAHAEEKNDWSDFTALCIFYVFVNLKAGLLCVACDIQSALKSFTSTLKLVMLVLVVSMMAKMNHPYEMNLTTVNKQIWPPCKQLKLQKIV